MDLLFYLTRYPGVGGIENVTNMIAKRLLDGNQISILAHIQQEGVIPIGGVTLFAMPNDKEWSAVENFEYVDKVIGERHFDAIIYQDSYAPTEHIVCEVAQKHNIPLYVFEHNSPLFVYNKRDLVPITNIMGLIRRILHPYLLRKEIKRKRYLLMHSTKYILLSKKFIPEFCKLIAANENDSRITYMNNPALPAECCVGMRKENIILCVSRLAREKCVDKMLVIWQQLALVLPDWKFIIVGDGPERSKLEHYVQKHQVPRVQFMGFAKPTEYYQRAKIFWMTSKFEGWGMTLIEAMQQGCVPVAYQTFSSITDIIDNGHNGYLVEPNRTDMFIKSTILLACNDQLWHDFSKATIKKVDNFSIKKIVKEWNNLIKGV